MFSGITKRLLIPFLILIAIVAIGISGYMLIEKWDFLSSLFMTMITLTTVGYGETHPLTDKGRIFTIFLLLTGFGMLTYVVTTGISFLLEGELGLLIRRQKMEKQIKEMKDHFILCVYGEIGKYIIEEFVKTKRQTVAVTNDQNLFKAIENTLPVLFENPLEDESLITAGIRHAKGLISALGEDRDNLFLVLSARELNADLRIITQAIEKNAVEKLRKAGANDVISTTSIGGMRIASAMLRPAVVSFLDTMLYHADRHLRVEEATISESSPLANKSLKDSRIFDKTGLLVVAIKDNETDKYTYNPRSDHILHPEDTIIVIGDSDQLKSIHNLINGVSV